MVILEGYHEIFYFITYISKEMAKGLSPFVLKHFAHSLPFQSPQWDGGKKLQKEENSWVEIKAV